MEHFILVRGSWGEIFSWGPSGYWDHFWWALYPLYSPLVTGKLVKKKKKLCLKLRLKFDSNKRTRFDIVKWRERTWSLIYMIVAWGLWLTKRRVQTVQWNQKVPGSNPMGVQPGFDQTSLRGFQWASGWTWHRLTSCVCPQLISYQTCF